MVYVDVVWRARHAYLEGEKYLRWAEHPEERLKLLDQEFELKKRDLDARLAGRLVSQQEYDRELDLLRFSRTTDSNESPLKYAYIWYKTAAELCTPPESKWSRMARHKLVTLPQ